MNDSRIIALYKAGHQEEAFNRIVEAYSERIFWHVRGMVSSQEDADDLVQEIFIRIWAALPSFREDARLFTWIYRIATNETLNFLNKRRLRDADSLTPELEERTEADPYFNGDEAERELMKEVEKLPDRQRQVFLMRYYEDMSYEDMSEILGTSVGALKASYHFAVTKLKSNLL